MEKLEHELAELRSRAETLHSRHTAAEAAFVHAETNLQQHLLEADLDGDEKVRTKLEAAVASCALTRDNFAKAITAQQAKIAEAEAKITAERAVIERNSAADKLTRDLDEFEAALPDYLRAARRIADAADAVGHFHFESAELAAFTRNGRAQIEVAAAFALQELRATANAIREGRQAIPANKPAPVPIAVIEQTPTRTVFCLRSIKWREGGHQRAAMQYEDATLPLPLADKALSKGVCVSVADDRRKTLKGARGGHHPNIDALDIVDLDAIDNSSGARFVGSDNDILAKAGFYEIDRSSEARLIAIPAGRVG